MKDYFYYKNALVNIAKPCAFVDMDALQSNIHMIASSAKNKKIRLASKSIRSIGILKTIFSASDVFQGVMCFTAEEAVHLYKHGFNDLLIAYPIWNEEHLQSICHLVKDGAIITLMIDSVEHIDHLESIAHREKGSFLVCIDIDLSSKLFGIHFGVHRSPIKTIEEAVEIARKVIHSDVLQLDGIMGYEAQIAGVTDADPNQMVKSQLIRFLKRKSSKELMRKRSNIINEIKNESANLRFINGGGTGSLHQTTEEEHVTEVTVGSGFFNSHLFDKYKNFTYKAAAGFAIEITRIPEPGIYTCFGGGYVASGAAGKDKLPEIFLPEGAKLTSNEGVGEVQTPVLYKGEIPLQHGDPIIFRHSKAGELCERFEHLFIIKDGKIIDKMATYRGDGKCFL